MKVWCAVRAQRGYGLIELLVSVATGLLLMTGLTVLLVSFDELADLVRQRADLQERVRLIEQMWRLALEGAGHLGCLADSDGVASLLNGSWAELGLLRPWPSVEIVQNPADSSLFSGINNLAAESHGLLVRGFAKPLGELVEPPMDGRGEAELLGSAARIDSGDVVLLGDCKQAVIFSATQTRHSSGFVQFSWAAGDGLLDNRGPENPADSLSGEAQWSVTPADFDTGARLYAPMSIRLYVAESLTSTPERRVFALWQKPLFGNALELVTGVERLALRYGAWRSGVADVVAHGVQIGYFDAANLPQDARVALLQVNLYLASHLSSDQPRWMPIALALPLTSAPPPQPGLWCCLEQR